MKVKDDKIKDLIAGYCQWLKGQEKRSKTIRNYQDKAEQFAVYLERHKLDLLALDTKRLEGYLHYLLIRKRLGSSTRRAHYYGIKSFYGYLVGRGEVRVSPTEGLAAPKRERRQGGCLTNEEIVQMIHAPQVDTELGRRDTAILAMLVSAGARVSALCDLKVSDIRSEEWTMPPRCDCCGQVDYAKQTRLRGKKKRVMVIRLREKGGKSWTIPVHDKAAFYLGQHLALRVKGKDSDYVFTRFTRGAGQQLSRHGMLTVVKKYAKQVGVRERVSPHSFRHAAITWLLDCGVDPMVVKSFVGHERLDTTEGYRHMTHRSLIFAGIGDEMNLLEAIETPMDDLIDKVK